MKKKVCKTVEDFKSYGDMLLDQEDYDEAISAYEEALHLKPGFVDALCGRGRAYYEISEYDSALTDFNRALLKEPDNIKALLGRAMLALSTNDKPAIADLEEVIRLDPNFAEAYHLLGERHMLSSFNGDEHEDLAFEALKKALDLQPEMEDACDSLRRFDNTEKVLDYCKKVIDNNPSNEEAWLTLEDCDDSGKVLDYCEK